MNNPNDIGMNLEAESFDKAQESMGRQFVKELDALLMAPTKGPEKSQILINGKWAKMQVEALKIAKRAGFGTERGGSKINIDTPKHWPTARPRIRIAAQAAAANEARERATIVGIIGMKVRTSTRQTTTHSFSYALTPSNRRRSTLSESPQYSDSL